MSSQVKMLINKSPWQRSWMLTELFCRLGDEEPNIGSSSKLVRMVNKIDLQLCQYDQMARLFVQYFGHFQYWNFVH